jgi:hypothetical protein
VAALKFRATPGDGFGRVGEAGSGMKAPAFFWVSSCQPICDPRGKAGTAMAGSCAKQLECVDGRRQSRRKKVSVDKRASQVASYGNHCGSQDDE